MRKKNTDPYKILGVSPDFSDEEIKAEYRSLVKKYHPDKYSNSPLADEADEKMKEINFAYEQIKKERKENPKNNPKYDKYSYDEKNTKSISDEIKTLMKQGRYTESEEILGNIPPTKRNSEWYYTMGVISFERHHLEEAFNYISTAYHLSPDNQEYKLFFDKIKEYRRGFNKKSDNKKHFHFKICLK